MKNNKAEKNILLFNEIDKNDLPLVGGKGANLGEMTKIGLPVPPGFVVTVKAYFEFILKNELKNPIIKILNQIKTDETEAYNEASQQIKRLIEKGTIPKEIALDIMKAYLSMGRGLRNVLVAVRSSATAEDLPTASFAGQQATFLNIKGEANVVNRVRSCWASLFEPRAIFYRKEHQFDHFKVGIAVPVQEMIQSDISGVMFTVDPITGEKDKILIEAIYGLGELIVRGEVIPDRYIIDRQRLKVVTKHIGDQVVQMKKIGTKNKRIEVPRSKKGKQKITDSQIIELAKLGKKIHQHYFFPQDIEWAYKGRKLYILQTRPITTLKGKTEKKQADEKRIGLPILLRGESASPGIASGPVRLIKSVKSIGQVKRGDILVTSMTTPDFVPVMKKVAAIVTDLGGQTSHAAIVSRELGVPCITGTKEGTKKLRNDQLITVNGKTGIIYKGALAWTGKILKGTPKDLSVESETSIIRTATKVYVNLAEPEKAEEVAKMNVDGVGLLRAEFMIAQIGIHPKRMIREKKQQVFINQLTAGLATFCRAFNPRPVVYRATDFKTNEYRNLKGGSHYEPEEENPLLGFRGAFRYLSDPAVFELELAAIKKVRNKLGFRNLWLMIPFVRTPEELLEVKKIVVSNGLTRSSTFKLWLMVEIPSNVILLEKFVNIGIDGVSIGSNDLTMLILGVDRDNSQLKDVFDERQEAVLWAIEKTINVCQERGITCSICGQAPSSYAEITEKLVELGITSVSVSPDAIDSTRELIYSLETRLVKKEGKK
ncbi:MAG TPA: phosphoenolpyruvate synthase [Candidatus Bathyarchaeia archaeon]|nr:phosphoenolpyruvate synthase [Candidatus Bathyarchaeia archaeon]